MPNEPGQHVTWYNVDDGMWHPGTVQFECCAASVGGPFTLVMDEFGFGHILTADKLSTGGVKTPRYAGVKPTAVKYQHPIAVVATSRIRGLEISPGMPISKLLAKGGR